MATKQLLIKSLQRPYDRILFAKEVLNPVFGSGFTLFNEPVLSHEQPNKTELQVIQEPVRKYGEIVLEDGTEVNCFEITLQPKVRIEQSRVAIQHFVRKLLTTGQAALVNFVSPSTDNIWRLTLVAKDSGITEDGIKEKTTHAKRYTYLVEKDRPNRTLAERLENLSLETVIDFEALEKAFSVETMSKAFFDEYKHHYQNFVEYLTGKRTLKERGKWVEKQVSEPSPFLKSIFNGNEKDARDFNKKLLGRIVFLYFVQKKRWLGATSVDYIDGSYDFIYQLFEDTGGDERFFPHGLTELFFNVLNKERPNDDYTSPTGEKVKIPYLNGGLFNRDEIDELLHKKGDLMTFPPHLFSNPDVKDVPYERGFLDFLNAYNFTVYEDSPNDHTVAVDPEMLGHIFENLLEDNKDKGAYYTPKEIVSYMCRESLTEYLVTHLSKEYKVYREIGNDQVELFGNEIKTGQLSLIQELGDKALNRKDVEQIVKDKSIDGLTGKQLKRINQLLDDVKICDPAIGSGAFPMGLLQEIFTIKEMIAHELHWDWKPDVVKEHIIQNSIYGVDIEKGAVDIARLRFWLSLIVDIEKPKALPNLDYKIVVGDSLVSKVKIDGTEEIVEINWDLKRSVGEADKYVKNIQKLLKEVVEKQTDFFNPDAKNKTKLKQEIRDLKIQLLINQLKFEKEKFQARTASSQDIFDSRKTKEQLDRELRISGFNNLIAKLEKLLKQPDKPFVHFDWKLDFPEVQNPAINKNPGFDIMIANPPYIKEYTNRIAFDGFRNSPYYQGKMDIWYGFASNSLDLLKMEGVECFIAQNNWITSAGASKFRDKVLNESQIKLFTDFADYKVFHSAGIQTMIYLLHKEKSLENYTINYSRLKSKDLTTSQIVDFLDFETNCNDFAIKYKLSFNNRNFKNSTINFSNPETSKILNLIEKEGSITLFDNEVAQGIVTPQNFLNAKNALKLGSEFTEGEGIFILSDEEMQSVSFTKKEREIIKPLYSTNELKRYYGNINNSEWIIYTKSDTVKHIDDYPNIKSHLDRFSTIITSAFGPYGLHRARDERFFKGSKILSLRKCAKPTFTFVDFDTYVLQTYYVIKTERVNLKYLVAILNSKIIEFWLRHKGKLQGELFQVDKEPLLNIPIKLSPEHATLFETFVDFILFLNENGINTNQDKLMETYFVQILNGMVYEVYFPELLKKHNCEIIKHLGELPALKESMSDDEKLKICKEVFHRLNDKSHPVRNNLYYMHSIPEIRIIEQK